MEEISIIVEYKDHYTTVLHSPSGNTFTFNPETSQGQELADFLMLCFKV